MRIQHGESARKGKEIAGSKYLLCQAALTPLGTHVIHATTYLCNNDDNLLLNNPTLGNIEVTSGLEADATPQPVSNNIPRVIERCPGCQGSLVGDSFHNFSTNTYQGIPTLPKYDAFRDSNWTRYDPAYEVEYNPIPRGLIEEARQKMFTSPEAMQFGENYLRERYLPRNLQEMAIFHSNNLRKAFIGQQMVTDEEAIQRHRKLVRELDGIATSTSNNILSGASRNENVTSEDIEAKQLEELLAMLN